MLIIGGGLLLASQSGRPNESLARLSARMDTLQSIIELGKKNAKSPSLQKSVSDASILTTGNIKPLQSAISRMGINTRDKAIIAGEADSETIESLQTAAINARFDETYLPVLKDKVSSVMSLLKTTYDKTPDKTYKATADKTYKDCAAILRSLEAVTI